MSNNENLTAPVADHVSAKGLQNANRSLGNGKAKKRNQAEEAIDESAALPTEAAGATQLDRIEMLLRLQRSELGGVQNSLANHEERIGNLEGAPSFASQVEALITAGKAGLKPVDELVRKADSARLPWGFRHVNQARNSTFGRCLELGALAVLAGMGAYQAGSYGYGKIRGS